MSGFNFGGLPAANAAAKPPGGGVGGFSFGAPAAQPTGASLFGTPQTQATGGFKPAPAGSLPLGAPQAGASTGISFGSLAAPATTVGSQLGGGFTAQPPAFGSKPAATLGGGLFGAAAPQTTGLGFAGFGSLGAPQTSATPVAQSQPPAAANPLASQATLVPGSQVTSAPTFGTLASTSATPAAGFGLGAGLGGAAPAGGLGLGAGLGGAAPAGGLGLGAGLGGAAPAGGFGMGLGAAAPFGSGVLGSGQAATTSAAASTLGSGSTTAAPSGLAAAAPGLGTGTLPGLAGLSAVRPTLSTAATPSLAASAAGTAGMGSGIKLGGTGLGLLPAQSTTATPAASLGAAPLQSKPAGSTLPLMPTASTATSTLLPGAATTSTAALPLSTATATTTSSAATTLTQSADSQEVALNYRQLEEAVNRWTLDLEEQEKIFLQQATQVNAWDRVLVENGDKITELNVELERVKIDQSRLDQELDFIVAQQREIEEALEPLEQSISQLPALSGYSHVDIMREHTYTLAENVDAQLKRIGQDLKDVVERLNASSSAQDSTDPMVQVTKILNAHMDSLQWVDQNIVSIQKKVDELSKVAESRKSLYQHT